MPNASVTDSKKLLPPAEGKVVKDTSANDAYPNI